jgi:hypothetical protein
MHERIYNPPAFNQHKGNRTPIHNYFPRRNEWVLSAGHTNVSEHNEVLPYRFGPHFTAMITDQTGGQAR